eukprot:scaffold2170_cov130-Ochromonas_danica.AAC.1
MTQVYEVMTQSSSSTKLHNRQYGQRYLPRNARGPAIPTFSALKSTPFNRITILNIQLKLFRSGLPTTHVLPKNGKNEEELFVCLKETWKTLPTDLLERLADSMPRRVQAVIEANGGPTNFALFDSKLSQLSILAWVKSRVRVSALWSLTCR